MTGKDLPILLIGVLAAVLAGSGCIFGSASLNLVDGEHLTITAFDVTIDSNAGFFRASSLRFKLKNPNSPRKITSIRFACWRDMNRNGKQDRLEPGIELHVPDGPAQSWIDLGGINAQVGPGGGLSGPVITEIDIGWSTGGKATVYRSVH